MDARMKSKRIRSGLLRDAAETAWMPFALAVAAMGASMLLSLVLFRTLQSEFGANVDPDRLGDLARNISLGHGYTYSTRGGFTPAFDRGPVYPFLVALVFDAAGGPSLTGVRLLQAVLHGLTCLVVFRLGARMFDRVVALAAEAVCAFHPMLLWYTARIWIETTHTLFLSVTALTLFFVLDRPTSVRAVLCGAAMGVTALTKSIVLPFPLVAALFLAPKGKQGMLAGALLVLSAASVFSPWVVRSYQAEGTFVPVHTSAGLNMIQGDAIARHWSDAPLSTLRLWEYGKTAIDSILRPVHVTPDNPQGDRILAKASLSERVSDPLTFLKGVLLNAMTFWYLSETPVKSVFLIAIEIPLMVLTLGSCRILWYRTEVRPCVVLVIYFWLVHALIVGWARYSLPILPICIILAVGGVDYLLHYGDRHRIR